MSEPHPLRALTIDLWNTLIYESPEIGARRAELRRAALAAECARLRWPVDATQIALAHERVGAEHAALQHSGRDISAEAHVGIFLDLLDPDRAADLAPEDRARFVTAYSAAAMATAPLVHAGVAQALEELRGMGFALALVSNTGRTPGRVLRRFMEAQGLTAPFTALIFSDEVGLAKPNPDIFDLALAALGASPAAALHIGDDLILDVLGAHNAGLGVIHIGPERPADLPEGDRWAPRFMNTPRLLRPAQP